jgi:UDP-N-acetylglucosamine 2-epimerase (non-hydrolysing)/UDP-GlcNAc3NAcA epimerase
MNVVSIVGARPEFVQVAVLSRALRLKHTEILIHTGQHYDVAMSERFFEQLGIAQPDLDLGVGGISISAQVGEMLRKLADALEPLDADLVIVRGDTNSTLAGGLVAKHMLLPLVHIEAGMRSYDRTMPEEINRVTVDHLADLNLTTDRAAVARLAAEGIVSGVHACGDVMYDAYLEARARPEPTLPGTLAEVARAPFDLLTLHRSENVDDRARLRAILDAFDGAPRPVVFPVHPRTRLRLDEFGFELPSAVVALEPLGYLEMLALEARARAIFTDSGGVQREAYFAGVPCVTLRDATEWTNTVEAGWNRLAGASTEAIRQYVRGTLAAPDERPALFGDGDAAERILAVLESDEARHIIAAARALRAARR